MPLVHCAQPADAARFLRAQGVRVLRGDSRRVAAGDAFVAWPGHGQDARRHVADALRAGAAACVVERDGVEAFGFDDPRIATLSRLKAAAGEVADAFFEQPSRRLDVVAVTGTNGKTSTAWWVAQALQRNGRACGLIGTLGIGRPGSALDDTGLTTPDPLRLHEALARFAGEGCRAAAIEASSIGIVEHRLAGLHVAVALFTNLTQDHLDYHGTMDAYAAAKRSLFAWPGLRAAVINVDDATGARWAEELQGTGLDLWTCSLNRPARLQGRALRHGADGLGFDLVEDGAVHPVASRFVGTYNAANLLLVIGALRALGVAPAAAVACIPQLDAVPGRLQPVGDADAALPRVLVDYAHTPDALQQVLAALRPLVTARGGRLWCVFGCGGNRDTTKRPLMGAIATCDADEVVLTSDNPRDESPGFILSQILAGTAGPAPVAVFEDRAEAIGDAVARAAAADVVLVAGKGHEPYQEVRGVRRPFSDVAMAAAALERRRHRGTVRA